MMSFRRKKSGEKSHDLLLVMTSNIGLSVLQIAFIRYGAARVSVALRSKQVVQFDLTRLYNTFQFIDL